MAQVRTPGQREADREAIASMLAEGRTFREMQAATGLSSATVASDVQAVKESWRDNARQSIEVHVGREVAKFDRVERVQWNALARTNDPIEQAQIAESISRVLSRRCKALGLESQADLEAERRKLSNMLADFQKLVVGAVLRHVHDPKIIQAVARELLNPSDSFVVAPVPALAIESDYENRNDDYDPE